MRSTLSDWVRLCRIEHSFITLVFAQAVVVGADRFLPLLPNALFSGIGPGLITAASFVINDWYGYKTDKANKRADRPLASGRIDRATALYAAVALFLLGLLFVVPLGNTTVFLIAAVYALLAVIYDPVLKKMPLAGNVFVAASMAVPFVYGNMVVSQKLDLAIVLLSAIAFVAGIGRELIITLRDVKGDRAIGAKTLPMILGPRLTSRVAAYFLLSAVGLSFVPAYLWFSPLLFLGLAITDLLFVKTVVEVLHDQKPKTLQKARNATLLAMAIGTLAFGALAFH